MATMKVGELCQFICKPEYAYGSAGCPPKIPPNATLVFEVSVSNIRLFCLCYIANRFPCSMIEMQYAIILFRCENI